MTVHRTFEAMAANDFIAGDLVHYEFAGLRCRECKAEAAINDDACLACGCTVFVVRVIRLEPPKAEVAR